MPSPRAQLVLYWLPASRDDMRHSELLTSRALTLYSTQCVAMHVVRPDDFERLAHLGANGKAPLVLLVDAEGREVTHVDQEAGALRIATVEKMLRDQLRGLEDEAERSIDEARRMARQRRARSCDRDLSPRVRSEMPSAEAGEDGVASVEEDWAWEIRQQQT